MVKNVSHILATVCLLAGISSMTVCAGNINANEAGVIQAARGTFEYNGKTYVAKDEYLAQLEAKLSEDGIDLNAEQASEVISEIYANVATGVSQGYVVEAGSMDPPEGQTESGNADKEKKDKKKPAGHEKEEGKAENGGQDTGQPDGTLNSGSTGTDGETEERDIGIGQIIASDSKAVNYEGYDIYKIYKKEAEERTEEENKVYEKYLAEKAVESLNIDGKDQADGQETGLEHDERENSSVRQWTEKYGILAALTAMAAVLGVLLILMVIRIRKITRGKKGIPDSFTDIHTHVLPGLDDGAEDEEVFMELLTESYNQGVRQMIATPHYRSGHRHRSVEEVQRVFEQMKKKAQERWPDFELQLGNEVFYSDGIEDKLEQGRALTLADSRYVLVEFRKDVSFSRVCQGAIGLLRDRYIPVIAHVERYPGIISDKKHIKELRDMGVLMQLNAESVWKYRRLLKKGYIDFLATDCHDMGRRAPKLRQGINRMCAYCSPEQIQKILVNNPEKILKGK